MTFKLNDLNGLILRFLLYCIIKTVYVNGVRMYIWVNTMIEDFVFRMHVELTSIFLLVFFTTVSMMFTSVIKYLNNRGMSLKRCRRHKSFSDNPLQSCSQFFLQETETKISFRQVGSRSINRSIQFIKDSQLIIVSILP